MVLKTDRQSTKCYNLYKTGRAVCLGSGPSMLGRRVMCMRTFQACFETNDIRSTETLQILSEIRI